MTTTKTPAKKFAWNDETCSQAAALYAELLGATYNPVTKTLDFEVGSKPTVDLHTVANSEKALNAIAVKIGAKSGRAVRGKLSKEGVYITLEAVPTPSTSTRISKGHYVRSIAEGLGVDLETIQTLDKANLEALETLTAKLNGVLKAAEMPEITVK